MNHTLLPVYINSNNRRSDGITLVHTYCFGGISCPVFLFCHRAPKFTWEINSLSYLERLATQEPLITQG